MFRFSALLLVTATVLGASACTGSRRGGGGSRDRGIGTPVGADAGPDERRGGSTDTRPPSGMFSDPYEGASALNDATCAAAHRCDFAYSGGLDEFHAYFGYTASECQGRLEDAGVAYDMADAAYRGTTAYDASSVGPCLTSLASADCGSFWSSTHAACEAVFTGSLPLGYPCETQVECAQGLCLDSICSE